jgi:predicted nucleic acid-binding protein
MMPICHDSRADPIAFFENDTPFIALALEINSCLFSGDEKLKKALENKGFDRFFLTKS